MGSDPYRVVHYRFDLAAALQWQRDRLERAKANPGSVDLHGASPYMRRCEVPDCEGDCNTKPMDGRARQ